MRPQTRARGIIEKCTSFSYFSAPSAPRASSAPIANTLSIHENARNAYISSRRLRGPDDSRLKSHPTKWSQLNANHCATEDTGFSQWEGCSVHSTLLQREFVGHRWSLQTTNSYTLFNIFSQSPAQVRVFVTRNSLIWRPDVERRHSMIGFDLVLLAKNHQNPGHGTTLTRQ